MHIAVFSKALDNSGGLGRVVENELYYLNNCNHHAVHFSRTPDIRLNGTDVEVRQFPYKPIKLPIVSRSVNDFLFSLSTVNTRDFDVILAHSYPFNILANRCKQKVATPFAVYCHGRRWHQSVESMKSSTVLGRMGRIFLETFHGFTETQERKAIIKADTLICNSSKTISRIEKLYGRRGICINPGIDPDYFRPLCREQARKWLGLKTRSRIILAIGRIERNHGQHLLIEALKNLEDIDCFFIGAAQDPNYFQYIVKQIKRMKNSHRIHFLGRVNDLRKWYAACDVVAYPAIDEDFGLVPLESCAMERPVVLWDDCGCVEDGAIQNERNGFVAKAYDVDEFSEKLRRALQLGHRVRKVCRKLVLSSWTWRTHGEKLLHVLSEAAP